jgi:hypothetical protein
MDIDVIPSPVIESVIANFIEEKYQQNPTTEEMGIDLWSELQNPITKKNHTQQTRFRETQPQEQQMRKMMNGKNLVSPGNRQKK